MRRENKNYNEFLKVALPSKENFITRNVRRITARIPWLILKTNISAEFISILDLICGFIAGVCIALSSIGNNLKLLAIIFLILFYILDFLDGEVARVKGTANIDGAYLDLLGHNLTMPILFLSLGIHVFLNSGNVLYLLLGSLSAIYCRPSIASDRLRASIILKELLEMAMKSGKITIFPLIKESERKYRNEVGLNRIAYKLKLDFGIIQTIPIFFVLIYEMFFKNIIMTKLLVIFYGITIPLLKIVLSFYYYKTKHASKILGKITKSSSS